MNWEAISAIGQIVGGLAVVVSLIYLAREIRRNARLARQSSVDTLNVVAGQLAQHPRLAQLFDRGIRNLKSLEGADRVSFEAFMLQWFISLRKCIISTWRGIWIHACGMRSKRPCVI